MNAISRPASCFIIISAVIALLGLGSFAQTPPPLVNGVPPVGYIVWNMPDGIYRYTYSDKQTRKIVDMARTPKIDLLDGTRIAYAQPLSEKSAQVMLMNPEGENKRPVGGVFRWIFEIDWASSRALAFTAGYWHPYGGSELWFMDTTGKATKVPNTPIDTNKYGMAKFIPCKNNLAFVLCNCIESHLYRFDQSNPAAGITWLMSVGPCGLDVSASYDLFNVFADGGHASFYIKTVANPPVDVKTFNLGLGEHQNNMFTNYDRYSVITQARKDIWFLDLQNGTKQFVTSHTEYEQYFAGGGSYPTSWVGTWAGRKSTWPLIKYTETDNPAVFNVTMEAAATAKIYYRTDGGVPTTSSTLYNSQFPVTLTNDSMVLSAIACDTGIPQSRVETCVVRALQMRTPDNPSDTVHGLNYSYYELTAPQHLCALDTAKVVSTGTIDTVGAPAGHRLKGYGYIYRGYLSIPTTGRYKCYLESEDGSALYVGTNPVVITDGQHSSIYGDSGIAGLQAGLHEITIYYFLNENSPTHYGDPGIWAYYSLIGGVKKPIPASALYRVSTPSQFTITSPRPGQVFKLGDTVAVSFTYAAGASMPVFIEFSGDGGQTFSNIMSLSILTGANGACVYKWVIPKDQKYVTAQGLLKVRDYVMPSINTLTGTFSIQNLTAAVKPVAPESAAPQLRFANGRIVAANAGGYRIELFSSSGRRINAVTIEAGNQQSFDLGRNASGIVIYRITKAGQVPAPERPKAVLLSR